MPYSRLRNNSKVFFLENHFYRVQEKCAEFNQFLERSYGQHLKMFAIYDRKGGGSNS